MATELRTDALGVESHTIDHIPEDERHGKARNLFTIWFGGQIMMLTIATGLLATVVYGLPVWAALLAMAIGNVVGGVVMALHAAQGPQMGVPQMLQTRAQFGSYGSLLVVVIVVGMYVAFFSSNIVLGGQALNSLVHIGSGVSTILIGLVSVVGAVFGYRLLHAFGTVMSFVAGGTLLLVFVWVFLVHGLPAATFSTGAITPAGFMATVSLAALWQIAYAPYVFRLFPLHAEGHGRSRRFLGDVLRRGRRVLPRDEPWRAGRRRYAEAGHRRWAHRSDAGHQRHRGPCVRRRDQH